MSNETRLEIFACYHQFYLEDKEIGFLTEDLWENERALLDMMDVRDSGIAVGTARYYSVPVTVRVLDSELEEDFNRWDHVTEASLSVPSGSSPTLR